AGAIAKLLDLYPDNPIIGFGRWVESKKRELQDHHNPKKQKEAIDFIHKQLHLSAEVTPLKFFNNLPWFERKVIDRYYRNRLPEDYTRRLIIDGKPETNEEMGKRQYLARRELIKSMGREISTLALLQEKLIQARANEYKRFIREELDPWIARGRPE